MIGIQNIIQAGEQALMNVLCSQDSLIWYKIVEIELDW
jgi:hypothetical protein